MQLQIKKWGNSSAVRLPQAVLAQFNLAENDKFDVEIDRNSITLIPVKRKAKGRKSLAQLLEGIDSQEIEQLNAKGTEFASKKAEKWLDFLKSCEVIETSKNSTKIEIGTKFYMLISYPGKEKENDEKENGRAIGCGNFCRKRREDFPGFKWVVGKSPH